MKEYYYLKKTEKIGPIKEDEIIKLNLSPDTLIWEENFDNWTKISEITSLNKKMPPPPPKEYFEKNRFKSKKIIYFFLALFVLTFFAFIFTYFIINEKLSKSREELKAKVESLFNGQNIICDGENYLVEGKLERHSVNKEIKLPEEMDSLELKSIKERAFKYLAYPTSFTNNSELWSAIRNQGYFDYYHCHRGGFNIKKIKKLGDIYEYETITSSDLVYKCNIAYNLPVQEGYTIAYDYIIKSDPDFYQNGYYELINNFPSLRSDFHFIARVAHPTTSSLLVTHNNNFIQSNLLIVFYDSAVTYHKVSTDSIRLNKAIRKIGMIEVGLISLILIVLLTLNPLRW